jgi:hypothetical protein
MILFVDLLAYSRLDKDFLLKDIYNLGQLMNKVAFEEGFTSIDTITLRRKLDLLLSKLETASRR